MVDTERDEDEKEALDRGRRILLTVYRLLFDGGGCSDAQLRAARLGPSRIADVGRY